MGASGTIAERAAMHAALGEPIRLEIVELLALGDAAPGELAERLGLGTNLLAHHLNVLQDARVIRRVRSEGDRRRSYVRLRLDDPGVAAVTSVGPGAGIAAGRVLFVCTANSARSQLAAAAWNRISPVPAVSAGTHPAARVHPRAITAARRHGLRLGRVVPRSWGDVRHADDLVVAVCDNAFEELPAGSVRLHWAIPDPARRDDDLAFDTAYDEIALRVHHVARSVTPGPASAR